MLYYCRHYLQVDTDHRSSGVQGEEGQGAAAEDSQGTKESEDERGTDLRRSRSSSNKDKKGREGGKEEEIERDGGRGERESGGSTLTFEHCLFT